MFLIIILTILPIWFCGFRITRFISSEKRLEVLLPVSLFGGITLFIFLLNSFSYLMKPPAGIYIIYILFFLFGLFLKDNTNYKIDFPKKNALILLTLSVAFWFLIQFQLIGHMNLTGDPFIYQTIGQSFIRGNFPIYEPWEPDIKLSYHYGPSIFLGAFHQLTTLSFDLIHRTTSLVIGLMLSQFLIWIFKRHFSFKSLLIYQLLPLICEVALGNWMIVFPFFPFRFPYGSGGLINWLLQLPTGHVSYDTYGGAINDLNSLVYFYHELIGLVAFIWVIWLSYTYKKEHKPLNYFFICSGIVSIAIINEVFFPLSIITCGLIILLKEYPFKNTLNLRHIFSFAFLVIFLCMLVIFQGGTFTELIFGFKSEIPTTVLFPNKEKIFVFQNKDVSIQNYERVILNWGNYQKIQQSSKLFSDQKKWYPFRWLHPGFIYFYLASILIGIVYFKLKQKNRLFLHLTLLIPAITATLIYNITFVIANNSSRLIAITYILLGSNFAIFWVWLVEYTYKKRRIFIFLTLIELIWLSFPSFLPPLIQQLKPAEATNRLVFQEEKRFPPVIDWVYKNLPFNNRVLNLVPKGYNGYTLAKVGIFTPTWPAKVRAYTMDGSPEYYDALYTLNPSSLNELKITHLIIDSEGFSKLPKIRQDQILNPDYFQALFVANESENYWEAVYLIKDKYYKNAAELSNTFKELDQKIIPTKARIYVDTVTPLTNKELSAWFALRRALIFSLRDRDLYYAEGLPSGNNLPYQHVEARVSGNQPSKDINYDYLALFNDTTPNSACNCQAQIIWKGFEDNIVIWKVLK